MPGRMMAGMADVGCQTDTGMRRNAESHTAARFGSHLDTSDGTKTFMEKMKLKC